MSGAASDGGIGLVRKHLAKFFNYRPPVRRIDLANFFHKSWFFNGPYLIQDDWSGKSSSCTILIVCR